MAFVFACLPGDTNIHGCGRQTGGSPSDSTTAFVLLTLAGSFAVAFGLAFEVLQPLPFFGFFLTVYFLPLLALVSYTWTILNGATCKIMVTRN